MPAHEFSVFQTYVRNRPQIGLPEGGSKENLNDWGPRLGLAYDVFGDRKTALRGGLGIFYDRLGSNVLTGQASNPPFVRVAINTTVRFDSAGRPTGGYGAVNAAGPGRVLSFGLKFLF